MDFLSGMRAIKAGTLDVVLFESSLVVGLTGEPRIGSDSAGLSAALSEIVGHAPMSRALDKTMIPRSPFSANDTMRRATRRLRVMHTSHGFFGRCSKAYVSRKKISMLTMEAALSLGR